MKLSELVEILNINIKPQYRFKLDPIYTIDNDKGLVFLGNAESIFKDITPFPFNIYYHENYLKYLENKKLIFWINNKIFSQLLNDLLYKQNVFNLTYDVRLRIAINNIDKTNLTKEEKIKWNEQLIELYHNRLQSCFNYYYDKIIQLPF